MWQDEMQKIVKEQKEYHEIIMPRANPLKILALSAKAKRKYGVTLPKGYLDFLRSYDGMVFNGYNIFGTQKTKFDIELIEQNEFYREDEDDPFFYFGFSDMDLFVYDSETKKYEVTDGSGEIWASYDTFEELLEYILKGSLEGSLDISEESEEDEED